MIMKLSDIGQKKSRAFLVEIPNEYNSDSENESYFICSKSQQFKSSYIH